MLLRIKELFNDVYEVLLNAQNRVDPIVDNPDPANRLSGMGPKCSDAGRFRRRGRGARERTLPTS